jgi:hypothetical protein
MSTEAPVREIDRTESPHRWWRWVVALVAVLALAAVQTIRQQGVHSWNSVWAEDGTVFFQGTRSLGSLFHTYSGYLELVPRLLGWGANLVPLDQVSRYIAAVAAIVTALCGLAVYGLSGALVRSQWLRVLLGVSVGLLPAALYENLNSITNVIWPLLFACFWALLVVPTSRRRAIAAAVVCVLAALSSVLALLYLPVTARLAWKRRDVDSRIVLGSFVAASVVQGLFVVTASDSSPKSTTHAGDLLPIYSVRVLGSGALGEDWLERAWRHLGYGVGALAAVVVVLAVTVLLVRTGGTRRCLGALAIAQSVVMFVVPVALRGSDGFDLLPHHFVPTGARFATLSLWLLISGIAILLTGARLPAAVRTACIALLVVQFAVVAVHDLQGTNSRSGGPAWSDAVAAARAACRGRAPGAPVALGISPPGWQVHLTCDRVDG